MSDTPPTLTQFILDRQVEHPGATGDFSSLLNAIAFGGKCLSAQVRRAGLQEIFGAAGSTNVTGDDQRKLDVIANRVMVEALAPTGLVCALGTEEVEAPIRIHSRNGTGKYVVVLDPLDGSSNIEVAAPIGTIFGIFERKSKPGSEGSMEDMLQPGRNLKAAGYIVYGAATVLVYSTGNGVHAFTLDPSIGEFLLTSEDLRDAGTAHVYSANEGNYGRWCEADRLWVEHVKKSGYSARYIGSLIADFHRNLLKGGIYAYPGDSRSPNGKLRLLFECGPMAFIAEQAGGAATDGQTPILDIVPTELHQRTPFYVGSAAEVKLLEKFHREARVPAGESSPTP